MIFSLPLSTPNSVCREIYSGWCGSLLSPQLPVSPRVQAMSISHLLSSMVKSAKKLGAPFLPSAPTARLSPRHGVENTGPQMLLTHLASGLKLPLEQESQEEERLLSLSSVLQMLPWEKRVAVPVSDSGAVVQRFCIARVGHENRALQSQGEWLPETEWEEVHA